MGGTKCQQSGAPIFNRLLGPMTLKGQKRVKPEWRLIKA
jgi:hypothetical protein